jgi:CSLREA domain-containing protein
MRHVDPEGQGGARFRWRATCLSAALMVAASCAALMAPAALASSLTFSVNTTADASDAKLGDGVCADTKGLCTLRAAIGEANVQAGGATVTIYVPAGTYRLTRGTLAIKKNSVTILGGGTSSTVVSGVVWRSTQLLTIAKSAHVALKSLTLTGGKAGLRSGGALSNAGSATLTNVAITNSTAAQGGAIYNSTGAALELEETAVTGDYAAEGVFRGPEGEAGGSGGNGGGIYNLGTLVVAGGSVSGDYAGSGARSKENAAGNGGSGGGIWNAGQATLTGVAVSEDTAGSGGLGYEEISGRGGSGGGIYNAGGSLTVSGGSVTANTAGSAGPAEGDTSSAAGGNGGGIANVASLQVIGATITGNKSGNGAFYGFGTGGKGGGISNGAKLTIEGSTLSENTTGTGGSGAEGGSGGALYNFGSATLATSTVSANSTGTGGESGPGGSGAGAANTGTLTITASTFDENTPGPGGDGGARDPGPGAPGGLGGSGGAIASSGKLTALNSTIYDNGVGAGGVGGVPDGGSYGPGTGGGILTTGGTASLRYLTIDSNAGDLVNEAGTLEATGTILAASIADPNCSGAIIDGGFNLDTGTSCAFTLVTDQSSAAAGLGSLAANGGPTETVALLSGSAAIDTGATIATGCPSTDQRGVTRPDEPADGGACDIGAYESQGIG